MITVSQVALAFGGKKLFDDVNLKFTPGNCYGVIGANGAGKSTFLKLLSGELSAQSGQISMSPGQRLSVLKQDHFAYEDATVLHTVLMGNQKLYKIMKEKDEIYAKGEMTDEDGMRASELEAEFAELNGWEAESEAGVLLAGLGLSNDLLDKKMKEINAAEKVKVLLGQALFGSPDVLLLDEPTNHLDAAAIRWLENFLLEFRNTVIVVSHDRHFLNTVCTHMADIDFGKITIYAGNYDFWVKSSELALKLRSAQAKKTEDKAKELKAFIQRFSANASKSKQATSRQKQLEKLQLDDLPRSSRKYPYVHFEPQRDAGKDILKISNIGKAIDGIELFRSLSLTINKGDKVALIGKNGPAINALYKILAGEMDPDYGEVRWGVTTHRAYFPSDNSVYFEGCDDSLVDWLKRYSEDKTDNFVRGFLGKMLFSGEDALKKAKVLSGGEKARCMYSKMMLAKPNVLLVDDPTGHLDLESITAVNEGFCRFNGTIIFSSHDHEFIQTVANRIIVLEDTIVEDRLCRYEDYLASLPEL